MPLAGAVAEVATEGLASTYLDPASAFNGNLLPHERLGSPLASMANNQCKQWAGQPHTSPNVTTACNYNHQGLDINLYTYNEAADQEAPILSSNRQNLSPSLCNDAFLGSNQQNISSTLASLIISQNIKITDIHDLDKGNHAIVHCSEPSQAVIHQPIPLNPYNYLEPLQNLILPAYPEPDNHPHTQVNQEPPYSELYPRLVPRLSALTSREAEKKHMHMSDLAPQPVPQCSALSTSSASGSIMPASFLPEPSSMNTSPNLLAALQVYARQRQIECWWDTMDHLVPESIQADGLFSFI
ncbi:hypothetical protein CPB84DRAFT_1967317 [Gymnopilus junonius]|uniref:Uncharacterized protein n=1 Tax=Gymnopilus junonius TaxID=109634 RepID=A0A9P5TFX2_GYMJU|nr:hypothetical protein CPB84DRAFT_1967317 [Gymnopilus junonius]